MIIAISTPPNLDPTPEAERLAARHGLRVLHDPTKARVNSWGFQTLYDLPHDLQMRVREELIREHAAELGRCEGAVLTYSVVAWLADWMRWAWHHTPTDKWEQILAVGREAVARYDTIYHLASAKARAYDGFAWLDTRNGRQVEGLMRHLYGELDVAAKVQSTVP
jgi:hypothetical protein